MATVEIVEVWSGRRGSIDQNAVREYTRVYRSRQNTTWDTALEVLNPPAPFSVPSLLDSYIDQNGNVDTGAICNKVTANQHPDDPMVWDILAEYSTAPYNPQQRQTIVTPLDRPPIFDIGFRQYAKPIQFDVVGQAILTSAGEPFTPLPEVDDFRLVVTCTRNEATVDLDVATKFNNSINLDTFLNQPPGSWKCTIQAKTMYEDNFFFWTVTYTFEYRPQITLWDGTLQEGWSLLLLNQGYYILDSNNKPQQYLDQYGNPPASPVLLDLNGHLLADKAQPTWQDYQVYVARTFANLNIPQIVP